MKRKGEISRCKTGMERRGEVSFGDTCFFVFEQGRRSANFEADNPGFGFCYDQ